MAQLDVLGRASCADWPLSGTDIVQYTEAHSTQTPSLTVAAVRDVKELTVYIKAHRVTMEFFDISKEVHTRLTSLNSEVGKMLRSMHEQPEKFLTPSA